jgi:hypothetical protein
MKVIYSAAILLINGLLSPGFALQQNSIAFVTEVKGTVQVKDSSGTKRITHTTFLREKDIVKTGANGRAWFYQAYARAEMLKPHVSKRISRLSPAVGPNLISLDRYAKLETRAIAALQDTTRRSPGRMSGPDELTITALAPRKSFVMNERPTFEWTPVKDAKSYELALYDSKLDKPIWQTTTTESRAVYPDSLKPLLPGRHRWEVIATIDQNHRVYDATDFTVAGEWQVTAANCALKIAQGSVKHKGAVNLFYISACIDLQLYPTAEAELKRILRRTPDDRTLWALLMQVYEYMERYEDRNRVFDYLKDSKPSGLERLLGSETSPAKK